MTTEKKFSPHIGSIIVAILIFVLISGGILLKAKYENGLGKMSLTDDPEIAEPAPPKEEISSKAKEAELVKRMSELEEQHKSLKKLYAETAEKLALTEKKCAGLSRSLDEMEDAQDDFFDEMEARLTKLTKNQKEDYAKLRDEINSFAREVQNSRQTWK